MLNNALCPKAVLESYLRYGALIQRSAVGTKNVVIKAYPDTRFIHIPLGGPSRCWKIRLKNSVQLRIRSEFSAFSKKALFFKNHT